MESKEALIRLLAEPFPAESIKFRPGTVSGNRALALAYVDARDIADRLDAVVGVDGWQDKYTPLANGTVVCELTVQLGERAVTKSDVGGESAQPDEHDRTKAAFSDSLKRAASKFGIARYLYRLPKQWCDYDPQRKQFVSRPQLPAAALPRPAQPQRAAAPQPPKEAPRAEGQGKTPQAQQKVSPQLITREQGSQLALALKEDAGIVHTEGALKGTADCRGLLKFYRHALLREITIEEYRDALSRIKNSPQDFKA